MFVLDSFENCNLSLLSCVDIALFGGGMFVVREDEEASVDCRLGPGVAVVLITKSSLLEGDDDLLRDWRKSRMGLIKSC